ncbi:MAG: hypothetical protein IJW67_01565 [Blautia sp.]|nr:hypothetical protein [Blautia sp.]
MPRIPEIDTQNAPQEIKDIIREHVASGHIMTGEKRTLLHNAVAFHSLETASYALDDELQRLIGKRAADFYEYAISVENDCIVCTTYFANLLRRNHIDFDTFAFTPEEDLLIEYGRAIAKDHRNIPDELFDRLKATFTNEQIVVITAMGVLMVANNYFNDIMDVTPDQPVA